MAADYPTLTVIEQNQAHERISMKLRSETLGKAFLDAYPDTSDRFKKTGKSEVVESIHRVLTTGEPDNMPIIRYDLQDESGDWVVRYWKAEHFPIKENGEVVAVYQSTKDVTNENKIEQTLAQTQRKLLEVLAAGQVGTWSMDLANGIVKGGPNLSRMFGLDPEKVGKGVSLAVFSERIHPDDRQRVQKDIEVATRTGNYYEEEYRVVVDGEVRWVLARGQTKAVDLDGENIFSGTLIDITDRKEHEHTLAASERRLRFMGDSMPQLVWISAPDGRGEYFNRRWYEFTGADAKDSDIAWTEYIHPDDREQMSKAWAKSIKNKTPYEMEYRLFHAPSEMYRWVIVRAIPYKADDGSVINWYGTCTDIDDQRRTSDIQSFLSKASKELSSSLKYEKTLKKVTQLCVPTLADWCTVDLVNSDGTFEQVSIAHHNPEKLHQAAKYRKLNPIDMSQPTGLPNVVRTGKSEFYPVISNEMLESYIEDEEKLAYMKSFNLHSIIIAPIKINGKIKGGVTLVSSDSGRYYNEADLAMANDLASRISLAMTNSELYTQSTNSLKIRNRLEKDLLHEKQKLELRVKERTKQLQLTNEGLRDEITRRQSVESELSRSNKELEDFAYVASHDLQEPLRKIQAFGNLLLGEYGDSLGSDGADYLKRMHSAASRMSTLIEDLLTFSRVGRRGTSLRTVSLTDVLTDVVSDLEARISETNATVKVGKLPSVKADPTHMRQLFQNLVGNAVKFHRPDVPPVVSVESKIKHGGYEIRVTDNGIGFDERYLDRIFAVFQRLNERSSYEGTGIGLAVCRKIVERYGGTITAESTKNQGSIFIIWLPVTTKKKKE